MPSGRARADARPARSRRSRDYLAELHAAHRRGHRRQARRLHPRARQGRPQSVRHRHRHRRRRRSTPWATPRCPSPSSRCRSRSCTATRCEHHGREAVLKHVGVEPTGEAFNSIVLDEVANRPFNPMVNAGAIAVAELMERRNPGRAHRQHAGAVLEPRRPRARDRRGGLPVGAGDRPSQPRDRLHDAQLRHDRARSERGARPLFPAVLGHRHGPRPRHHGRHARQ